MGLTVTQLSFDFGGSNPSLPTENLRNLISEVFCFMSFRVSDYPMKNRSVKSLISLTPISENPTTEGESPLGFDIDPDEVGLPHFDRVVIDRFPGLLSDVLKVAADDREYDLMLLSSLTVLSTIMPGVSGMLKKQL